MIYIANIYCSNCKAWIGTLTSDTSYDADIRTGFKLICTKCKY